MSLAAQLAPLVRRYATEVAEGATRTLVREAKKAAPVYKADARDPRPRAGRTVPLKVLMRGAGALCGR